MGRAWSITAMVAMSVACGRAPSPGPVDASVAPDLPEISDLPAPTDLVGPLDRPVFTDRVGGRDRPVFVSELPDLDAPRGLGAGEVCDPGPPCAVGTCPRPSVCLYDPPDAEGWVRGPFGPCARDPRPIAGGTGATLERQQRADGFCWVRLVRNGSPLDLLGAAAPPGTLDAALPPIPLICERSTDCTQTIVTLPNRQPVTGAVGRCSARCTIPCVDREDCPRGANWECRLALGAPPTCQCVARHWTEIPCNGVDDDCDGTTDPDTGTCDGTCVDLANDPAHCGGCGRACPGRFDHGRAACRAGACGLACDPGFADCDGLAANGCETPITSEAHCGGCGRTCAVGRCVEGSCACPPGQSICPDGCFDLATSNANCGACGAVCPGPFACYRSRCGVPNVACPPGCRTNSDCEACWLPGEVRSGSFHCAGSRCAWSSLPGPGPGPGPDAAVRDPAASCGTCQNDLPCRPCGQSCVRGVGPIGECR